MVARKSVVDRKAFGRFGCLGAGQLKSKSSIRRLVVVLVGLFGPFGYPK
jgi:hypothetical protein